MFCELLLCAPCPVAVDSHAPSPSFLNRPVPVFSVTFPPSLVRGPVPPSTFRHQPSTTNLRPPHPLQPSRVIDCVCLISPARAFIFSARGGHAARCYTPAISLTQAHAPFSPSLSLSTLRHPRGTRTAPLCFIRVVPPPASLSSDIPLPHPSLTPSPTRRQRRPSTSYTPYPAVPAAASAFICLCRGGAVNPARCLCLCHASLEAYKAFRSRPVPSGCQPRLFPSPSPVPVASEECPVELWLPCIYFRAPVTAELPLRKL